MNRGCGLQAVSFNSQYCCKRALVCCYRKIRTTDGAERTMRAGEVLFQDDVEKSPAKKTPKHWSGKLLAHAPPLPVCLSLCWAPIARLK